MQLAIISKETNLVENVIIPPKGADAYFVPPEYLGKLCEDNVGIGWSYDPDTEEFSPPPPAEELEEVEEPQT